MGHQLIKLVVDKDWDFINYNQIQVLVHINPDHQVLVYIHVILVWYLEKRKDK